MMPTTAQVRTRLPVRVAKRTRWITACGVIELDLVWCSRIRWDRSALAQQADWYLLPVGPFVVAAKVSC